MSVTRNEFKIPGHDQWYPASFVAELDAVHREQHIILVAQRDKLLLENRRLKEQNARQVKTITESDIAIENAAARLHWFQAHVAELRETHHQ
jgi:hypothetical protein